VSKPVLIGRAPSRTSNVAEPLSGKSGARLARLCGMELPAFLASFERWNLIDYWPGEGPGKGDRWLGRAEARALAESLRGRFEGRRVVILGFSTAAAFRLTQPAFTFCKHWGGEFAFTPHPSGVVTWWNEPSNLRRAETFFRALAREAARGP
jgi:hypothetical protein